MHLPIKKQPVNTIRQQISRWKWPKSYFTVAGMLKQSELFDRILQLEPNWERPKQHRSEAENYLRTGYIPVVALPADAASAYGKAQSAARVGRYADALALLEKAQSVLHGLGIQRWQEGQEFAQKLQENIDAEKAYEEGLALFQKGQIDEANR